MSKKTATTKPAASARPQPAKAAAKKKVQAQPAPANPTKGVSLKPSRARKPAAPTALVLSPADIATRAYYVAENRRRAGLPGDEHQDWLTAEQQLRAEAAVKPARKKRPSAR